MVGVNANIIYLICRITKIAQFTFGNLYMCMNLFLTRMVKGYTKLTKLTSFHLLIHAHSTNTLCLWFIDK